MRVFKSSAFLFDVIARPVFIPPVVAISSPMLTCTSCHLHVICQTNQASVQAGASVWLEGHQSIAHRPH
jgi:hypothetical protein